MAINSNIINSSIETSNYIAPLAFSIISFYVFIFSTENQIKPFGIALAGLFLAIAIGMKLTYITLIIPFIAIILFYPLKQHVVTMSSIRKIHYILVLFIAGLVIGLLPMLFFFFSDDVSVTIRNIVVTKVTNSIHKIATLSPLFIVESNLPIYSELSTGPFLYRIGDLLTLEDRNHFVGTSPESIHDLFAKEQPAAILVGFEENLDKPLIEYAMSSNYTKVDVTGFDGTLYVQP